MVLSSAFAWVTLKSFFISRFSVEIVGGIENYTNMTEEALKVLCVGTDCYCSILCVHREGPVQRKQ